MPWGGHFSTDKTISRIARFYFWIGMRAQITRHCTECIPCQLRKTPPVYNKQQLLPWPTTTEPLICVSVDIFGPIKMSRKGNTVILVMTDFLTRYIWSHPLPNQTAPTIAQELLEIFLNVGFPQQLVSDSRTNFTSTILNELCQLLQIDKYTVTPIHHSANGLIERFMRTLQTAVTLFMDSTQSNWCDIVPFVTFAYNSGTHSSIGDSPFYLMFHRQPRLLIDNLLHHQVSPYNENPSFTDHVALDFQLAWYNMRQNLKNTQQQQKQRHDKDTKPASFRVGEDVFIIDTTPQVNKSWKLTNKYKGPFRCIKIDGNHLFLVPHDKPEAKPLRWHMEFAKHAKLPAASDIRNTPQQLMNDLTLDTQTSIKSTTQWQKKTRFQYPLDAPAPNRYPLRSKSRTQTH